MRVYQTDYEGWFVGTTEADESPLEPGVFLVPGGCVIDPPPVFDPALERARRVSNAWVVFPIPQPEPEPEPDPEPAP